MTSDRVKHHSVGFKKGAFFFFCFSCDSYRDPIRESGMVEIKYAWFAVDSIPSFFRHCVQYDVCQAKESMTLPVLHFQMAFNPLLPGVVERSSRLWVGSPQWMTHALKRNLGPHTLCFGLALTFWMDRPKQTQGRTKPTLFGHPPPPSPWLCSYQDSCFGSTANRVRS